MAQFDGIDSDKTSLPANDQQANENQNTGNQNADNQKQEKDKGALKGNYRAPSKKGGRQQPVKKTGDHNDEEGKQLGDETEITDETTI